MPFSFRTRSQPVVLFSNSSWKRMSPGLAGGKVGIGAGEQEARRKMKAEREKIKNERGSREARIMGFYQSCYCHCDLREVISALIRRLLRLLRRLAMTCNIYGKYCFNNASASASPRSRADIK